MSVSAVIPAYNEEKTISGVISAIRSSDLVDEIIVVSDGSKDNTAMVAQQSGVRVVINSQNMGKGAAVKRGIDNSSGEVILFLDADLIGIKPFHISKLLIPVINDQAEMTIGLFSNGRVATDMAHKFAPQLSGQRAVRRSLIDRISDIEKTGYGIETALTNFIRREHSRVLEVLLEDVTHVMKEEKLGLLRGFRERIKMYRHIYRQMRLAKR